MTSSTYLLPLHSPLATLEIAGGKGANLSRLIRAGFPVPGGFILTTAAYALHTQTNDLAAAVARSLRGLDASAPAALGQASAEIRRRFAEATIPPELAADLAGAYHDQFGLTGPVAVRSSATAEDLPDLSFAGQQDTFLDVVGADALLRAVTGCWSSLWTARAIGYRARNNIPHASVSLAVVVQAMAPAQAAGVLFTANPLTGMRAETVIDATLGLGEALVSGQVEPDHYVVDTLGARIIEKRLGSKGTDPANRSVQAIPDTVILDLTALCARVAAAFGAPQDIEWTWGDARLALVQSRPITSLYPLPEDLPEGDFRVLGSFGAFQGVLGPFTPLGQDVLRLVFSTVAGFFGYTLTHETQGVLRVAGERLWVDFTGMLRNAFGRRLTRAALGQVEPSIGQALLALWDDPRLAPRSRGLRVDALRRMAPIFLPLALRFARTIARPDHSRRLAEQGIEAALADFTQRAAVTRTLADRLALLDQMMASIRHFMFDLLLPRFAPGMASLNQLYVVSRELPGGRDLASEITRGLPHNVTTEMDLALWQTARRIQADPAALAAIQQGKSAELAAAFLSGHLPPVARSAIGEFIARYGARGPGEIDLGRPRWREDPTPVIEAVQSYVTITDPERAPDAVFARGAASAEQAIARLSAELKKTRFGRLKAARARWAARRVRALAGLRETPKFTIIRLLGLLRENLLRSGEDLARTGLLSRADDIFYLSLNEVRRLAAVDPETATPAFRAETLALVSQHRRNDEREARRRQVPRVLLSDGRAFHEGVGEAAPSDSDTRNNTLRGSPVSPGVVEGRVNVVLDPRAARMAPGDVLVCPGTDPSWTPLFLVASALVMEVGGLMTHGSVVAREYGIPAVVGVYSATTRLRTGQRVRVDGSKGLVTMLDDSVPESVNSAN